MGTWCGTEKWGGRACKMGWENVWEWWIYYFDHGDGFTGVSEFESNVKIYQIIYFKYM